MNEESCDCHVRVMYKLIIIFLTYFCDNSQFVDF